MPDSATLLADAGPFAQLIDGFAPRPQQQQLANAIAQALTDDAVLVAEAGTGTGKTLAYLVPALRSGKKVIVSTGTRNLQDQLYHKDLPLVRKALLLPISVALLKGRTNYLCLQRLGQTGAGARLDDLQQVSDLSKIRSWANHTQSGDIAEARDVSEDSPLWQRVTSTVDNCLGQDCPKFNDCFLVKARRQAAEADLIVINHHLFCADMAIKEEGFGEILPGADAFILDEAHQLPDTASHFFGLSLSSHQLLELARDSRAEQIRDAADFGALGEQCEYLEKATADLRLALGQAQTRAPWTQVAQQPELIGAVAALADTLALFDSLLREAAPRGKGLSSCQERCNLLRFKLRQIADHAETAATGTPVEDEQSHDDLRPTGELVRWFETYRRGFALNATPLDIGPVFRARMAQYQSAWVFTSATLAVDNDFGHFCQRLGLREPRTLQLASPFDYARNALLYHPKDMPEPATPDYTDAVLNASLPVLRASRGRAFILFTSHQALRQAAARLTDTLEYPLLVQGTLPKSVLLERFRQLGNAVLLGTASFWEGVDVRGDALSCVIIAKFPFAAPDDPVLQARCAALRRRGGNPFMDYQLPQAVIALKQGVGRLIRDVDDRGVLILCDPRLLSKSYGRVFLNSLPPMARTRSLRRVAAFFDDENAPPEGAAPPAAATADKAAGTADTKSPGAVAVQAQPEPVVLSGEPVPPGN